LYITPPPGEPVARLVEHVGDAVRAGETARIVRVAERAGRVAPRRQEEIRRVRRRRDVLQVVGGVGPSAAHRNEAPGARRVVDDDPVLRMDGVAEERIPSRALLTHVDQQRVGDAAVDAPVDADVGDGDRRRDAVAPLGADAAEVEPPGGDARSERRRGACRGGSDHRRVVFVDDVEVAGEGGERRRIEHAEHGDLGPVGEVAELVDAQHGARGRRPGRDASDAGGRVGRRRRPARRGVHGRALDAEAERLLHELPHRPARASRGAELRARRGTYGGVGEAGVRRGDDPHRLRLDRSGGVDDELDDDRPLDPRGEERVGVDRLHRRRVERGGALVHLVRGEDALRVEEPDDLAEVRRVGRRPAPRLAVPRPE
jgi:hypothetical protein